VDEGLSRVLDVLAPFVRSALAAAYGAAWWTEAVKPVILGRRGGAPASCEAKGEIDQIDLADLLSIIERCWARAFMGRLAPPARAYVAECRFIRNRRAHFKRSDPWTVADALRAVDTMRRLASKCAQTEPAPATGANELEQLLDVLRRDAARLWAAAEPAARADAAEAVTGSQPDSASTVQLPLKSAYDFAEARELGSEAARIKKTKPPSGEHGSVYRRALFARLLEEHDLLERFIKERWPHGKTKEGRRLLDSYRRRLGRLQSRTDDDASDAWKTLEALIGLVEGPEDWAVEHDHYLRGSPKRTGAPKR